MPFGPRTPAGFAAGTIVTSDYLPWARVLASSFAEHHPGVRFVVAVLDELDPGLLRADDRFEVMGPGDLGIGPVEFRWMAAIYDRFELSCALKPWLLRLLLSEAEAALYLDSDILVCDSLADVAARAASTGLVLSPHLLEPPPRDGLLPDEDTFLQAGQYNGGLIAVGREGAPFLDWWSERLARQCLNADPATPARFVDQRWLDLAPNYFPVAVLRDRGVNVAYWNLATRSLARGPDGYLVDGEPLRCFHFSGFNPGTPAVLTKYQGIPARVDPLASAPLRELCESYGARLLAAGLPPARAARPLAQLAGIALTPPVRSALRAALIAAESMDPAIIPDPGDSDALWSWLRAPVTPGGTSWYLWGLHCAQPALRNAFPRVPGPDEQRFLAWSENEGSQLGLVPAGLTGAATALGLDGLRSFVTLADAAEIVADPHLLSGVAEHFCSTDELTLLIHAAGFDPDAIARELEPLLETVGLDGADAPDLVAVVAPAASAALAPAVHAVLTRRPPRPALARLPHVEDATAMHALFAAAGTPDPRACPI